MAVDQIEQLQTKLEDLSQRLSKATEKKAELRGQLDVKKRELLDLVAEIEQAGYDPKKLKEERDKKAAELQVMMTSFEKELAEVEAALAGFETKP